ncbi:MAG: dTMP kinase [Planctomycetota bacterium]|nr:dTMP kinase [Planctomycetota bacterium]
MARLVAFEGIDGSGKSYLSALVAEEFRRCGVRVVHTREGGELQSSVSRKIRKILRDPSNLELDRKTEAILYFARETELVAQQINPHLEEECVIIADRFFYSHLALAMARGLSWRECSRLFRFASAGVEPEVVVLVDVEPEVARMRRKMRKVMERRVGEFSRKGLAGEKIQVLMRRYLLDFSKKKRNWFVVENNGDAENALDSVMRHLFEKFGLPRRGNDRPGLSQRESHFEVLLDGENAERFRSSFYIVMERLAERRPREAAYLTNRIGSRFLCDLRTRLSDVEPDMVAYSLHGLTDEVSWNLRWRLVSKAPDYVALSLEGINDAESWRMRSALLERVPAEVIISLTGLEGGEADELRLRFASSVPDSVVLSLRGRNDYFSWRLRESLRKDIKESSLALSLKGVSSEKAQKVRMEISKKAPAYVILSTEGLEDEFSWELRESFKEKARKLVLRSIKGLGSERAWRMREEAGDWADEVLESVHGMDCEDAWKVRKRLEKVYPAEAVRSLCSFNQSDEAWRFRWRLLKMFPQNLRLARNVEKALWRRLGE